MDFSPSERQQVWLERVRGFMAAHVYPAEEVYRSQMAGFGADRWQVPPILEDLKVKARAEGLWNLFLPPSPEHDTAEFKGAGA